MKWSLWDFCLRCHDPQTLYDCAMREMPSFLGLCYCCLQPPNYKGNFQAKEKSRKPWFWLSSVANERVSTSTHHTSSSHLHIIEIIIIVTLTAGGWLGVHPISAAFSPRMVCCRDEFQPELYLIFMQNFKNFYIKHQNYQIFVAFFVKKVLILTKITAFLQVKIILFKYLGRG